MRCLKGRVAKATYMQGPFPFADFHPINRSAYLSSTERDAAAERSQAGRVSALMEKAAAERVSDSACAPVATIQRAPTIQRQKEPGGWTNGWMDAHAWLAVRDLNGQA